MLYAIADGDQCWLPLMINKKKFRSLQNKQKRRLLRLVETRKGGLLFCFTYAPCQLNYKLSCIKKVYKLILPQNLPHIETTF